MNRAEVDALEECLERLQSGASLDQVLAHYPQYAEELRPMLESALQAWSLRTHLPLPEGSMARSQARFIEKAAALAPARGSFNLKMHVGRPVIAALSTLVILAIATSLVSAKSLPGDILYPVKLAGEQTRLLFTTNTAQRLTLEESYEDARTDEVEDLLQFHRQVEVTFSGLLTHSPNDQWQVSGVRVVFPPDLNPTINRMINVYVEVTGKSKSSGIVQVSQIRLPEIDFSGTIDHTTSNIWFVDQVGVQVEKTTVINGSLVVGAHVSVKAYRMGDGILRAYQIDVVSPAGLPEITTTMISQSDENTSVNHSGPSIAPTSTSSPDQVNSETSAGAGSQVELQNQDQLSQLSESKGDEQSSTGSQEKTVNTIASSPEPSHSDSGEGGE